MKRIDSTNARPDQNGIGKTGFNDNADLPQQDATYLTPEWLNIIQEELCNLLELNGIPLNSASKQQLYQLLVTQSDIEALAEAIDLSFIRKDQIVDDLITNDATRPASAKQAKALQDNKLNKTANAASASKLATARNIAISGAMQGNANFDGSGNLNIEVANPANLQVVTGSNYTITYDYSTRLAHIEMRVFSNQRIYQGLPRINNQSGHFKDITLPITLKKRLHTQAFFTTIDAVNVGQMGEAYEWHIWTPPSGIDGTTDSKVRISAARWMGNTDEFCNCDLSVTGYF